MSFHSQQHAQLLIFLVGFVVLLSNQAWAQSAEGGEARPLQLDRQFNHAADAAAKAAPTSANAQAVLSRVRGSIFQIRTLPLHGTTPISHGSAFLATSDGLAITNFHVVSAYLHKSKKHRLAYESTSNKTGSASVIAVDVANDMALLRLEDVTGKPPEFVIDATEKGATVYSLGFPLNVGFTLTEGIFNGHVKGAIRPLVHYSGALNPGMSGGPTVDGNGRVVGINVSGFRFSQLVNFLIPAKEAIALVQRGETAIRKGEKLEPETLLDRVQLQAQEYADSLISSLEPAAKVQSVLGYLVPLDFAPFIECTSLDRDPTGRARLKGLTVSCRNNGSVQLQARRQIGSLSFDHTILHTNELGAWRFAKRISEDGNAGSSYAAYGGYGAREHVGPYKCRQNTVAMSGFAARVLVCARAHREKPQFYDFNVRIMSLDGDQHGLLSRLRLSGVSFDPGIEFIERFLKAVRVE